MAIGVRPHPLGHTGQERHHTLWLRSYTYKVRRCMLCEFLVSLQRLYHQEPHCSCHHAVVPLRTGRPRPGATVSHRHATLHGRQHPAADTPLVLVLHGLIEHRCHKLPTVAVRHTKHHDLILRTRSPGGERDTSREGPRRETQAPHRHRSGSRRGGQSTTLGQGHTLSHLDREGIEMV